MTFAPEHFAVWTEIPVKDLAAATKFYETVLKTELKQCVEGPNPTAHFPTADNKGVAGHLYPGKPAGDGSGPTIHFASPDQLEAISERVREAGGKVISDIITIPDGKFVYCLDPDGNSIGLFTR